MLRDLYLLIGEITVSVLNKGKQQEQERVSMACASLIHSSDECRLGTQNCPRHFASNIIMLGAPWDSRWCTEGVLSVY